MMKLLWGENFYDTSSKKWTTEQTSSPTCKRGFLHFCYDLIKETLKHRNGLKNMQKWLPTAPCLLSMIVSALPSPAKSQKTRVENLYEGPLDDRYGEAIINCDPTGPVLLYLSKMIRASGKCTYFAFGRLFSGTIHTGMKVRIMGPNYASRKSDLYEAKVNEVRMLIGNEMLACQDVSCGNIAAVLIDDTLDLTNTTLTNDYAVDAIPIVALKDGYYRLMPPCTVDSFYEIPSAVFRELAHHQDGALRWFWNLHCKRMGGILGDDMGMGKTREVNMHYKVGLLNLMPYCISTDRAVFQISAFLLGLFHSGFVNSVIIIVPLTVLEQWEEELRLIGLGKRLNM
jgi:hypothetical protein